MLDNEKRGHDVADEIADFWKRRERTDATAAFELQENVIAARAA
jgi:hypothetical protein